MATNGYLLDTNVVSAGRKRIVPQALVQFTAARAASEFFISVLTLGEIRKGAEMKRPVDPEAGAALQAWCEEIIDVYEHRILPIDNTVAAEWGRMSADRSRPVVDTLLAATAKVHDLTVVTRNTRDFADLGVTLINPWDL